MHLGSPTVCLLAVALAAPICTTTATAEPLTGKVVGVTDGDTITVLVDRRTIKVRLAEIDTPERGQPWANRAKQALSDKVFGQVVELQVVDTDRYGRTVAKIYRGGRDINRERVREGHAWVYRKYLRDPSLLEDERQAREAGAGVWGLPEAQEVPPWEWRQGGLPQPTRPHGVDDHEQARNSDPLRRRESEGSDATD